MKPTLEQIPPPPEGAPFKLLKIQQFTQPHPFVIGPKHVAHASKYCGGMLDNETCKKIPCFQCQAPLSAHITETALFISVPQNTDLNAVLGLHAYLLQIKEQATALGIDGFAFPEVTP